MADTENMTEEAPGNDQDSIRDSIEAAVDQHTEPSTDAPGAAAAKTEKPPAPEADAETPGAEASREAGVRDALGRFAPRRDATAPAGAPEAANPALTPEAPPQRAPASWKAEEAQHWEKATPEIRAAVMRREVEINRAMQDASSSRRAVESLQEVIAPYMGNIQATGGDVVGSIKTFFDYDHRLRHGTQLEKAQAVTALIKNYGVDIEALDNTLAGVAPRPEDSQQLAVKQALERELAPMRQFLAQQQQREQYTRAAQREDTAQEVYTFGSDPQNKYFNQVRSAMADVLDTANAQGRNMTMQEAYESACWQDPQIRSMLLKEHSQGATTSQAAQRARSAAVSVKGSPRSNGAAIAGGSRMDDLNAAFDRAGSQE